MRSKLRSCILNGTQPVGKAGNAVDGDGRDEFDGLGADSAGFKPCGLQPVKMSSTVMRRTLTRSVIGG